MKIIDITVPINQNLPVWPGDAIPDITSKIAGEIQVSNLKMSAHTATHIDAPRHFIPGAKCIDELDLSGLIGKCLVIEFGEDVEVITAKELHGVDSIKQCTRILFKTSNSGLWKKAGNDFSPNYVALSGDAAQYLVDVGIKMVGIDYLSIAPFNDIDSAHKVLLKHEVIIVEGLNLSQVDAGEYDFICLPILISGAEGSLARAVLIQS